VEERAVITELGFSSACDIAGRLTKPALIRANVHGLHFICIIVFSFLFTAKARAIHWFFIWRRRLQCSRRPKARAVPEKSKNAKALQDICLTFFGGCRRGEIGANYCPNWSELANEQSGCANVRG
jgi:hypothetical protein